LAEPKDQALHGVHRGQVLKIKIEVDTDPPMEPFVKDPEALTVWSKEFFHEGLKKIAFI